MLLGISKREDDRTLFLKTTKVEDFEQGNKSLKGLIFNNNLVSPMTMKVVNILLRYNQTLKSLDLSGISMGDIGCHYLLVNIGRNHSLLTLKLASNSLTDESARPISTYVISNKS